MPKERSINPATAALKKDKKTQIKKSKANLATQRAEKYARRNPQRLQKQIDDIKATEASGGSLRPKDKQTLEALEKDLRLVVKAREHLGDKAPQFWKGRAEDGRGNEEGGVLGKRRRDDGFGRGMGNGRGDESETDEDVKDIPMPLDVENMPPMPRRSRPGNANDVPLGRPNRAPHELPAKPVVKVQTVYESAPVVRDLRKEAVSRFIPSAVASNLKKIKGKAALIEPEEADQLEKAGYLHAAKAVEQGVRDARSEVMAHDVKDGSRSHLEEQHAQFELDLRRVTMEDDNFVRHVDKDVAGAAEAAIKEAEYNMMAEEALLGGSADGREAEQRVERQLHQVEIEDVEDED